MQGSTNQITTLISQDQLCDDLRIGSQHDQSGPVMRRSPYRITTLISPNQLCEDLRIGPQHRSHVQTSYDGISKSDHNTVQTSGPVYVPVIRISVLAEIQCLDVWGIGIV